MIFVLFYVFCPCLLILLSHTSLFYKRRQRRDKSGTVNVTGFSVHTPSQLNIPRHKYTSRETLAPFIFRFSAAPRRDRPKFKPCSLSSGGG
ncbi:hypothetical protein BDV34DRAFT_65511 [Aspergillus parasiticus]|uniref:Uncharacterized protein n=1 Tax=Aspergillus parasiticus TaxID=5067 RepID=A0A5N6DT80_ASPPA|nr:hypothetical protein BDV34DRAFT_65511 [Aspergillus parasiticus]